MQMHVSRISPQAAITFLLCSVSLFVQDDHWRKKVAATVFTQTVQDNTDRFACLERQLITLLLRKQEDFEDLISKTDSTSRSLLTYCKDFKIQ